MDVQYLGRNQLVVNSTRFNQIYSFTTERISGYMSEVGENVLTVCGSGDHALNAILLGAKQITQFDLNLKALYWSELKFKALLEFSYTKFLEFFLDREQSTVLDYQLYIALAEKLTVLSRTYFDQMYSFFNYDGQAFRNSVEFNLAYDLPKLKLFSNQYLLNENNYLILKEKLTKVKIVNICSTISNLSAFIEDQTYDSVFLSNLTDYAQLLYPKADDYLSKFVERDLSLLFQNLNSKAKVHAAYIYGVEKSPLNPRALIDQPARRHKAFDLKGFDYQEIEFPGVMSGKNDAQIILQRKA